MIEGLALITLVASGFCVLAKARSLVVRRRQKVLASRIPTTLGDWGLSSAHDKKFAVLKMFADDLGVEWNQLHPKDQLHGILQLKGPLLIDEDISEDFADAANDAFEKIEWNRNWETISDAVRGVAKQIESLESQMCQDAPE